MVCLLIFFFLCVPECFCVLTCERVVPVRYCWKTLNGIISSHTRMLQNWDAALDCLIYGTNLFLVNICPRNFLGDKFALFYYLFFFFS